MDNEAATVLHDPALDAFLPLLYAAWEDGELDPDEIVALCSEIERLDGLNENQRRSVRRWLDPARPPGAEDLAHLARHIRDRLAGAGGGIAPTPADLGLALAGSIDEGTVAVLRRAAAVVGPITSLIDTGAPTLAPLPDPGRARFPVASLRALLDGDHAAVRRRVRAILAREEFTLRQGLSTEEHRRQVFEWLETLAHESLGDLGMPATVGGGADPGGFIAAFAELARHDLSLLTKFGVQFGLYAGAISHLGTGHHHRRYLKPALDLTEPGCFAMTETGHGSNVADLETTATYVDSTDELDIHTPHDLARKDYIGNAARDGSMAVVFARLIIDGLDHGVHAVVVPIRGADGIVSPGVRIEDVGHKAGLNGVDNGRLGFDHVRVPRQNLLDRFGTVTPHGRYHSPISSPSRRFFTTLGTLVGGRLSVGFAAVSAAETALTIAVRYATRRRQFRGPSGRETALMDYPAHQRRLMPALATTIGYHVALESLVHDYARSERDPGEDRRSLEADAAGMKAHASWHANTTIQACREACGGQGYLSENRLGTLRSDADVFTTYEGDNTVLAQLTAKSVLSDHQAGFEGMNLSRTIRYVMSRVGDTIGESLPGMGAVSNPTEPRGALELMARRRQHTVAALGRRLQKRIGAGSDAGAAFIELQPHALHVARAHTEWRVAEILRGNTDAADAGLRPILSTISTLFMLDRVEADLGWFLEHGTLTAGGAADVRRTVTRASKELAQDARHIVDSFGIPDRVLAAPIAL